MPRNSKTISQLNEECEIVIQKEIEQRIVDYTDMSALESRRGFEMDGIRREPLQQLYYKPTRALEMKAAGLKIPPSSSNNTVLVKNNIQLSTSQKHKRYVDAPIQATDERYSTLPRSTVLSRTRQHLCKRNSGAQSAGLTFRNVKLQTDNCAKNSVSVTVEPLDFIGMFEKATAVPLHGRPGLTQEKCTQMYDHITQSELYCIEWIHKNLFEVKLSPNTLVVDDRLRDHSESACVT